MDSGSGFDSGYGGLKSGLVCLNQVKDVGDRRGRGLKRKKKVINEMRSRVIHFQCLSTMEDSENRFLKTLFYSSC